MLEFLLNHWQPIAATIVTAILIPIGMKLWDGITGRRRDERLAATQLLPHAIKYKLYWVDRYHEDQSTQPDPDWEFKWIGDKFDPVLATEKIETIAARLSKPLRIKMFELEMLAHRWRADVAVASEYYTDDIDIIGPLAMAEMALDSDDLLNGLAKEAGIPSPNIGHDMDHIQSAAVRLRAERIEWKRRRQESQRKLSEELLKSVETKPVEKA